MRQENLDISRLKVQVEEKKIIEKILNVMVKINNDEYTQIVQEFVTWGSNIEKERAHEEKFKKKIHKA